MTQGVSLGKGTNGRKAPERGVRTFHQQHSYAPFPGLCRATGGPTANTPWATIFRPSGLSKNANGETLLALNQLKPKFAAHRRGCFAQCA